MRRRRVCEYPRKYLVHAWLDFNTKLQKNTPSAQVDQLVRSTKIKALLYLSEPGIRHELDGQISNCKSVDVLPRATAQNF